MTDDEALEILQGGASGVAWIAWDKATNRPHWDSHGCIMIDGAVSANELRAILHFEPTTERPAALKE